MPTGRRSILMLTPDQGFLDRRITQEARTLAGAGWSVDIFPTHLPLDPPAEMLAPDVRMVPRPSQPRASRARRFKHLLRDVAPRLHRMADGAQSLVTDRAGQIAAWNLDYLLGRGPYAAVFAHDIPVLPLAVRLKSVWGCAVICDLHEIYPDMVTGASSALTRRYWRRVESRFLPQADGILCVNAAVEEYVRGLYAPSTPIAVVHNSVPYTADPRVPGCDIRGLYGLSDARRVLAFAGTLGADTNIETLVAGFGRAHIEGWILALLGSGPLEERLGTIVSEDRLADRVFLGRPVPQQDWVPMLSSAHAGALPYRAIDRNHLISTPNKLFEYAQARLPIAASRLPMIERIITANGNGAFVDYANPATTAEGLRRFIASDLAGFSRDALEIAARNLSWERDEEAFLSVVSQALDDASGHVRGRLAV